MDEVIEKLANLHREVAREMSFVWLRKDAGVNMPDGPYLAAIVEAVGVNLLPEIS